MIIVRNTSFTASFVLAVLLLLSLSSCSSGPRPQSPVMEEATFVDFLTEAYLLEGFYAVETNSQYDSLHPEMIASYDSLLAEYNISRSVFDTTVYWYAHHPEIYRRVHDSVLARLDRGKEAVIEKRKKMVQEALKDTVEKAEVEEPDEEELEKAAEERRKQLEEMQGSLDF